MNILAIDTSLGACSAAVAYDEGTARRIAGRFELRERQHAETILPMAETALAEASLAWKDVGAVAVTNGPGSFTGVRVGVAAARGLALARGIPIIAANSLDVIARQALLEHEMPAERFAVAVDARRGEIYLATYGAAGKPLSAPEAISPPAAAAKLGDAAITVAVGGGAALVRDAGQDEGAAITALLPGLQPDARVLAAIAADLPPLEGPLRPLYLRPPDAKPQSHKAIARQAD